MQVVIVDDSKANLVLLEHLVLQLGECEAVLFEDPIRAYEWVAENGGDLVLADYLMPGINGIEFINRVRRLESMKEVPIVMVTSTDLKEIRYEALRHGATDFLNKPIDPTEFVARMTNLVALRQNQVRLKDQAAWLAENVAKATNDIVARENEIIFRLSRAAEHRDPETGAHIFRMAHYSRLAAEALELPEDEIDLIFRAAPMHDIGKVGIADHILLKRGKLTKKELKTMEKHTFIGRSILQNSPSHLLKIAAEIAASHHERFDGMGYPAGLAGEDISLVGRICAVADVFDALTSKRPYKKAWPVERARKTLKEGKGKHFDPKCVDAFLSRFNEALKIKGRYKD